MANLDRIYQRTDAGQQALTATSAALRAETNWVLGLIKTGTHADEVRHGLPRRYSDDRIAELLAELEGLGFIESVAATTEHNLDFTGTFSLADLSAAYKKSTPG
jgi:hypothetical protein